MRYTGSFREAEAVNDFPTSGEQGLEQDLNVIRFQFNLGRAGSNCAVFLKVKILEQRSIMVHLAPIEKRFPLQT